MLRLLVDVVILEVVQRSVKHVSFLELGDQHFVLGFAREVALSIDLDGLPSLGVIAVFLRCHSVQ